MEIKTAKTLKAIALKELDRIREIIIKEEYLIDCNFQTTEEIPVIEFGDGIDPLFSLKRVIEFRVSMCGSIRVKEGN